MRLDPTHQASTPLAQIAPDFEHCNVQTWICSLDQAPREVVERLSAQLALDERDRARRFHFPIHRNRYIACRGALRSLLALELGIDPREVQFRYGAHGKPALSAAVRCPTFNVAHSEGIALIALAHGCEIGVDIENSSREVEYTGVAAKVFAGAEQFRLQNLPQREHAGWFFRCWTRREAFLKAIGVGLATEPNDYSIEERDDQAYCRVLGADGTPLPDWTVRDLCVDAPYVAAIATDRDIATLSVRTLHWGREPFTQLSLPGRNASGRSPSPGRSSCLPI